jgi:predicted nucleic acid-binding protein
LIVLDTSGLLAALVHNQHAHEAAKAALEQAGPPFLLSPFVLAELDYLFVREAGVAAELAFLAEVAAGGYDLVSFLGDETAAAATVIERNRDLGIGLADASIVVLADRYDTDRVLTLDERHFRALRTLEGKPFTLLPADTKRKAASP